MVKAKAAVFELPQRLGIPQYVEHEPERCGGCLYTGLLTAEGCKRGVCVRYRVWLSSRDGRRWEAGERRQRRRRDEEGGGCLRQQIADALWELAERGLEVGVNEECGVVINGIAASRPRCRAVEECVRQMLEEYKRMLESPPPPRRDPEEEEYRHLIRQYAWLGWWRRDTVLDALKRYKQALLDLLRRLSEVPHFVAGFIGRFDLDFRCVTAVFKSRDGYCISFCVKDAKPATYCYEHGKGWRHTPQPKFVKLKPLEDGRLAEVHAVEDKELIRIA
ncbi:MAG: hypothetical protein ACO2PM_20090 [Pyrobaculum sp.]|jgi:hypothetical protein